MAEDLTLHQGTKKEQYESLIPQIKGLMTGEPNLIANLGNIAAALKEQFNCCLLYTSPSPRDRQKSRMPSSA